MCVCYDAIYESGTEDANIIEQPSLAVDYGELVLPSHLTTSALGFHRTSFKGGWLLRLL